MTDEPVTHASDIPAPTLTESQALAVALLVHSAATAGNPGLTPSGVQIDWKAMPEMVSFSLRLCLDAARLASYLESLIYGQGDEQAAINSRRVAEEVAGALRRIEMEPS